MFSVSKYSNFIFFIFNFMFESFCCCSDKMIYGINTNSTTISEGPLYTIEIETLILKCAWKCKGL